MKPRPSDNGYTLAIDPASPGGDYTCYVITHPEFGVVLTGHRKGATETEVREALKKTMFRLNEQYRPGHHRHYKDKKS